MRDDTKFSIIVTAGSIILVCAIIGIINLSAFIARKYGAEAGLMAMLLPFAVATVYMVIVLIRQEKKERNGL